MSAETLGQVDSQESVINNQERQKEAIRNETDRLYGSLDCFDVEQMQTLVDNLACNNPIFQTELINFQDYNSSRVQDMLKATNLEI
jgi:leucyl aminopeptidase (aminopeptidase T)